MKKCTSRWEGNYEVSSCTNLNRVINNKHCKYLYGHPSMCIELCACIARRSAWRAMKKCTSRLEGNYEVSNCTNLNHVSNNKHCKYHRVVLSSFGQTNQLKSSIKGVVKYTNLCDVIYAIVP